MPILLHFSLGNFAFLVSGSPFAPIVRACLTCVVAGAFILPALRRLSTGQSAPVPHATRIDQAVNPRKIHGAGVLNRFPGLDGSTGVGVDLLAPAIAPFR